ncbi:MAG: DUF2284 domain-containing protein, partial [Candidatus Methanomethylophilus sp.]|nr:DUF2284 domain-containing protein [Methanomethylophilus sp.]
NVSTVERCRNLCKQNICGCYDTNWGCPPGVGSVGDVRRMLGQYKKAAVLYKRTEIDHNDKAGLKKLSDEHQNLLRAFNCLLRDSGYNSMALADGGCNYCIKCTYPDSSCRFPKQRVCSVSGCGLEMMAYLETFGIPFAFEDGAVTLYGLILFNEKQPQSDLESAGD